MTVEEKAMQLSSVFPLALFDSKGMNHSQLDALLKNGIGHVSALGLIGHKTPETLASSSSDIRSRAELKVTGQMRAIKGEDRTFLSVATVGP